MCGISVTWGPIAELSFSPTVWASFVAQALAQSQTRELPAFSVLLATQDRVEVVVQITHLLFCHSATISNGLSLNLRNAY